MEIEITFRDIVRGVLARLGNAAWFVGLIWCGGVVQAIRGPQVVVGWAMTLMLPLLLAGLYSAYSKLDDAHRRVETRVDDDGVHHRTGGSSSVIAFADILRVRWTQHVAVLFLATGGSALVMTRGLDAESLRTLQQKTAGRSETTSSLLKVLVVVVAFLVVFAVLWTIVARGR